MSFKLLIECSKDISELHINFTDGTSVVTEASPKKEIQSNTNKQQETKPKIKETKSENVQSSVKQNKHENDYHNYLDVDSFDNVQEKPKEVISRPEIPEKENYKVAAELQFLDI